MHKKKFLYIGIPVAVLALAVSLSFSLFNNNAELIPETLPELNFTYVDSNAKLKESLALHGISMSSLVKLSTIKDRIRLSTIAEIYTKPKH